MAYLRTVIGIGTSYIFQQTRRLIQTIIGGIITETGVFIITEDGKYIVSENE